MEGGISEFFAMGGYAAFVWPSYAVSGLVLAGLFFVSWRELTRRQALLDQLQAAAPHRRRKPKDPERT
jgi:heme exporter protein D